MKAVTHSITSTTPTRFPLQNESKTQIYLKLKVFRVLFSLLFWLCRRDWHLTELRPLLRAYCSSPDDN
jgi:hypothetical protein